MSNSLQETENWIDINQCSLTSSCHLIHKIACELHSSIENVILKQKRTLMDDSTGVTNQIFKIFNLTFINALSNLQLS